MSEAKPAVAPQKVQIPDEWKARCDVVRLNAANKPDYFPLHPDFLRAIATAPSLDFVVFFAAGWDLYDVVRPKDFSPELIKEVIALHKQFPSATRICVRKADYGRYERLVDSYKRRRFEDAAGGMHALYEPAYKLYAMLSSASQLVVRGMIDKECYMQIARASSTAVMSMCSSGEAVRFLVDIIGKDASLYDHSAVTALLSAAISWNTLKLSKREAKLTVQSAILHDGERHCAYIGKQADMKQVSVNVIKEVDTLARARDAFHEANVVVMQQFRERFNGAGFPKGLKGNAESDPSQGIFRPARIVAISCAFSEYLLKRRDKKSLDLETIKQLMAERTKGGEFEPEMISSFWSDVVEGGARRPGDASTDDSDDLDDFDV